MEITELEFYRLASVLSRESKTGRFATKSPALLLPSEQKGKWRSQYYQNLLKRIKNGKSRTQYLFSLPYLKSDLNKLKPEDAEKILNWWQILLTYKTLDLRFTEESFDSCIISDKQILLKEGTKRFLISADLSKGVEIVKNFNSIFKKATKSNKDIISNLRRSL